MKPRETIIKTTALASLIVLMTLAAFVLIKGWIGGHFNSVDTLREYVASYGIWAPLILTLIQLLLAVLPVCPSFTGCVVGATLFGAAGGFWTNYIGISAGSIAAYALAKRYGVQLVNKMLPMAPDNFLCYFSGLVNMPARKFITIIITAKPWCILFYSVFFAYFI